MGKITNALAEFSADLTFYDLPEEVVKQSKAVLLDSIGCAIGGLETVPAETMLRTLEKFNKADGVCTIFGSNIKVSPPQAAYMNGYLVDILDFEETTNLSHPSATAIPSAVAMTEYLGLSGKDLLLSIVLGFEISCRLASATLPSPSRLREVATIFYSDAIGASAAAGALLGLNPGSFQHAFGLAAAYTPLPIWISKWSKPRHWVKNNFGHQAYGGVYASLLASEGFEGPSGIFDSDIGFWKMVGSDNYDTKEVIDNLGNSFFINSASYKRYSCCKWIQPALDATAFLVKENNLKTIDIRKIIVKTSEHVVSSFDDYNPQNIVDAEFSLPFSIAMVLKNIPPGPAWFSPDHFSDQGVKSKMNSVTLEVDEEADKFFKDASEWVAEVELLVAPGEKYSKRISHSRLSGSGSLSLFELKEKFTNLTEKKLGITQTKEIIDIIENLESLGKISILVENLIPK